MSDIRTQRQLEFTKIWLDSNRKNIMNLCSRFGKCRLGYHILIALEAPKTLICYPDEKIRDSWKKEFELCDYNDRNITYSTYLSLHKHVNEEYELVVLDEIHTLSENQIEQCKKLFIKNKQILGLTGTLSSETRNNIKKELSLLVEAQYPIELAIKEGVISDYEIEIIQVPLDDKTPIQFKRRRTEKKQFDAIGHVINKLEEEGKDTFFLRLARMRIIQGSVAKLSKTEELIANYKEERILVFTGTTAIADKLGIPSFHSKSTEKDTFRQFCEGEIPHIAICKMGNMGITFLPLSRIIFNSFDSDEEKFVQKLFRAMSFEYNTPEKIAKITIISSTEETELVWLRKALKSLNKDKIKYI